MTGSVREQVWRRQKRVADYVKTKWLLNLQQKRTSLRDQRVTHVRDHLLVHFMGSVPWFNPIDILNPQLPDTLTWFVQSSICVVDLNGQPIKRVQRMYPDTLVCEVYCRTQEGNVHNVDYYELKCGGVAWFPLDGMRSRVLEWLPVRFHPYVAPENLCEHQKQQFVKECMEKQQDGSRQ